MPRVLHVEVAIVVAAVLGDMPSAAEMEHELCWLVELAGRSRTSYVAVLLARRSICS